MPTATTTMSAWRTCASSTSRGVNLWQQMVVQPAISSSSAIGRPTWLLTPTITGSGAAHGPVGIGEQRGDAARRARAQAELAQGQVADVLRMEAVHVLARIDALDQAAGVGDARQRQLHQDAVHRRDRH